MFNVRILVCGSRDYSRKQYMWTWLDRFNERNVICELINGGAPGADTLAKEWADSKGIPVKTYPADWDKYGKAAGSIRNEQMLREGDPELVVAFCNKPLRESRGTNHMVSIAMRAGIQTIVADEVTSYFPSHD